MKFKVMSRKCDQCLMTPQRIVSKETAADIIKDCLQKDNHFLCHKGSIAEPPQDIACRGHYDKHPGRLPRMAKHFNVLQFIDPETLLPVKESTPCDTK